MIKKTGIFTWLFLVVFLAIIFYNFLVTKAQVLEIRAPLEDKTYHLLVPDKSFTLSFIHSVHQTPVTETFQLTSSNTLLLTSTTFEAYGVGIPFLAEEGRLRQEKGKYILELTRELPTLTLRVSPLPDHILTIGDNNYPLTNFTAPGETLEFRAKDKYIIEYLLN